MKRGTGFAEKAINAEAGETATPEAGSFPLLLLWLWGSGLFRIEGLSLGFRVKGELLCG